MSNFKKVEILQTPLRVSQTYNYNNNEFMSSQKQKFESQKQCNLSMMVPTQESQTQGDGKILYDNQIALQIKPHDREAYSTYLNLKINLLSSGQGSHSQNLHMEITDEGNPTTLYIMNISEQDYMTVKNEQNLLIDFHSFPTKMADLLEKSMNTHTNQDKQYQCVLELSNQNDALFKILQISEFNALVNLSLKFRSAPDDFLKSYLSTKLQKERQENENLRIKNSKLENQLQSKSEQFDQLTCELRNFQEDKEKTVENLTLQEQKKLNEAKETQMQKESNLRQDFEQKRRELMQKYESEVTELKQQVYSLTSQNQDLVEKKMQSESRERDLSNKFKLSEKELKMVTCEVENLRLENKNLDSLRFSQEKKITELSINNQGLEKQLKDKEEIIKNNKDLVDNTNNQRKNQEQIIESQKKQIEKIEKKIELCTEEINKGNDIIQKLQNDIHKQKQKIKTKNAMVLQQEQTVTNLQDNIDKLNKQINEINREKDNGQLKIKELENQVTELKTKLTESQKSIADSNAMVQYLNKQINDLQRPPSSNSFKHNHSSSQYSNSYQAFMEDKKNNNYNSTSRLGATIESNILNANNNNINNRSTSIDNNNGYTGLISLNYSQTIGKSPIGKSPISRVANDYQNDGSDRQQILGDQKENYDQTNLNELNKYLAQPNKSTNVLNKSSNYDNEELSQRVAPIKYNKPVKL